MLYTNKKTSDAIEDKNTIKFGTSIVIVVLELLDPYWKMLAGIRVSLHP